MSSTSTSATSTNSGHTELSSSDHQIAAAQSILHPRSQLARLKSGGATSSAGCSTSTNSQRDRVCAPHGLTLPEGTVVTSEQPDVAQVLSRALGHEVAFADAQRDRESSGAQA